MHLERDLLREHVFPVIDERLRERRYHLEIVDLRWGIWTSEEDEQAERQMHVLSVCLDEIERCRPFFLVLVGNQYGWIPPRPVMEDVASERGLALPDRPLSVTALEILAALDSSKGRCRPVVFLLRSTDAAAEVVRLRKDIRAAAPDNTFDYDREDLDSFVTNVLEVLWREIDAETAVHLGSTVPQEITSGSAQLEGFVEQHIPDFVGRASLLSGCLALAEGEEAGIGAIVGPSGSGKSALFAQLVARLPTRPDRLVLAHSAGMGSDTGQVDTMIGRFVRELAHAVGESVSLDSVGSVDGVDSAFAELLHRVSSTRRVILLIDGLDGFEDTPRAKYLTWMPLELGAHTLVIVTGQRCDAIDIIEARTSTPPHELEPLTLDEATQLIQRVCEHHHRVMDEQTLQMLLEKVGPDSQPAHGNPFWCRLATELLNMAGADLFRAAAQHAGDPQVGLRQQLRQMARGFANGPAEIVMSFLGYLEDAYGTESVRDFALILRLGRQGWRERDLLGILGQLGHQPWTALDVARLRRGFRAQLTMRSDDGLWAYAHQLIEEATVARYAQDEALVTEAHEAIVRYLRSLDAGESLRGSELMHHMIRSSQISQIASHFTSDLSEAELKGAVAAIADWVMIAERQASEPGDGAIQVLRYPAAAAPELFDSTFYVLRMGTDVDRALENRLSLAARRRLLEECLNFFTGPREVLSRFEGFSLRLGAIRHRLAAVLRLMGSADDAHEHLAASLEHAERDARERPDHPQALGNLAQVYFLRGQAHFNEGRMHIDGLSQSLEAFGKALDIMERVVGLDPHAPIHRSGIAAICAELGRIHLALGDTDRASTYFEHGLAANRIALDLQPGDARWLADLSSSLTAMGNLRIQQGRLEEAVAYHEEALQNRDRIAQRDPDDPTNLEALAISHLQIAKVLLRLPDAGKANWHLRETVRIMRLLLTFDPEHREWVSILNEASELLPARERG
jgi:tetratricopeptide (TPR) repeat protein